MTGAYEPFAAGPPHRVGDYEVLQQLREGRSWLARGPGGRCAVLKWLEGDCLLEGQLHPLVRDRLARVRELPHTAVADLWDVQRDGEAVFLVWRHVSGQTWDQALAAGDYRAVGLATALELLRAVELLHQLGIVHGALHGGNVIVRPDGRLCLTHISPLLHSDPELDVAGVRRMLTDAGHGTLLEGLGPQAQLSDMAARLLSAGRPAAGRSMASSRRADSGPWQRRRAMLLAATLAAAGAGCAWGLWKLAAATSMDAAPRSRAVSTGAVPR